MSHTIGPWHADEHMRIVGANGDVICDVDPFDVLDAAQANLALIAAAPELLAALETVERKLVWWLERHPESADSYVSDSLKTTHTAIAKAEAA